MGPLERDAASRAECGLGGAIAGGALGARLGGLPGSLAGSVIGGIAQDYGKAKAKQAKKYHRPPPVIHQHFGKEASALECDAEKRSGVSVEPESVTHKAGRIITSNTVTPEGRASNRGIRTIPEQQTIVAAKKQPGGPAKRPDIGLVGQEKPEFSAIEADAASRARLIEQARDIEKEYNKGRSGGLVGLFKKKTSNTVISPETVGNAKANHRPEMSALECDASNRAEMGLLGGIAGGLAGLKYGGLAGGAVGALGGHLLEKTANAGIKRLRRGPKRVAMQPAPEYSSEPEMSAVEADAMKRSGEPVECRLSGSIVGALGGGMLGRSAGKIAGTAIGGLIGGGEGAQIGNAIGGGAGLVGGAAIGAHKVGTWQDTHNRVHRPKKTKFAKIAAPTEAAYEDPGDEHRKMMETAGKARFDERLAQSGKVMKATNYAAAPAPKTYGESVAKAAVAPSLPATPRPGSRGDVLVSEGRAAAPAGLAPPSGKIRPMKPKKV